MRGIPLLIAAGVTTVSMISASPLRACDDRYPHLCQLPAESRARPAAEPVAKLQSARHQTRHLHIAHRIRSNDDDRSRTDLRTDDGIDSKLHAARSATYGPYDTYFSPRPIALSLMESLPAPRVDVALLDAAMTFALPIDAREDGEATGEATASPSTSIAGDAVHRFDQGPSPARGGLQTIDSSVTGNATDELKPMWAQMKDVHQSAVPSWVSLAFILWGGLLTLGSALRLVIG